MSNYESSYSALVPGGEQLPVGPVVILESGPPIQIEDETYSSELLGAVRSVDRGSYALLNDSMDPEVLEGFEPTAFFNEIPDLGRSRANSKHGVMFGQLLLQSPFGDERAELVAVKPFDRPKEVAKELSLTQYFSKQSPNGQQFHTFKPMGVLRRGDGSYGMISKYEHGVRSLDNVFYNEEVADNSILLQRAIGKCAALLAAMHSQGFAHGDAQVKNMFVSNHQEHFIADLESVKPFRMARGDYDELDVERQTHSDITTLVRSMFLGREHILEEQPDMPDSIFSLIYYTIVNNPQSLVPLPARKSLKDLRQVISDPYSMTT